MTTTLPYTPKANSKPAKALEFFLNNPDEELTAHEMAQKFGMVRGSVHTVLRPSVDAQLLNRNRDELGDYVYSRGPKLVPGTVPAATEDAEPTTPIAVNWPPAPKASQRGKRKVMPDPSFIAALPVDDGVPFSQAGAHEGQKWAPLFGKLTAAGQSVQFPAEWKTAVQATALKLNRKATDHAWRVRSVSETHARLWRLAK